MRTVRLAWVAAEIEAAGHQWKAPREIALASDRWGVQVNSERGGKGRRLPDLVFWPNPDGLPVAVVVEHGLANPRRERAALEGWKGAIAAGQYAQVRYVTDPSSARRLGDWAARVGLTATQLIASEHVVADELAVPAEATGRVAEVPPTADAAPLAVPDPPLPVPDPPVLVPDPLVLVPEPPRPAPVDIPQRSTAPTDVAIPEQAAERQKLIRELLGQDEPPARRRWRRRSA